MCAALLSLSAAFDICRRYKLNAGCSAGTPSPLGILLSSASLLLLASQVAVAQLGWDDFGVR